MELLRLTWPESGSLVLGGVAVVYSQAEGGRQARLVGTAGIVDNRPLYLPEVTQLGSRDLEPKPGRCRLRNDLLSLE